ncbi:hypothetical protein [Brevibacillus sp. DP1.3A]|uniref:hypothetical protein n=1 Tax=Brevibacillus sp. DP1.3A TaxID=2738867 RepID=UPI00156B26A9|nr:hypothetical protein [Brevibacillus sp. DP1.3A]UED78069.1 hypothetical protein HP399_030560 [Brevibacillus sp. DP1.3A]
MAHKIYQLPLDEVHDKEIIDRLDKLPRTRKAEWVRAAIRFYMAAETGGPSAPVVAPAAPETKKQEKPRKEPKSDMDFG